jgi:hypothetical protein
MHRADTVVQFPDHSQIRTTERNDGLVSPDGHLLPKEIDGSAGWAAHSPGVRRDGE